MRRWHLLGNVGRADGKHRSAGRVTRHKLNPSEHEQRLPNGCGPLRSKWTRGSSSPGVKRTPPPSQNCLSDTCGNAPFEKRALDRNLAVYAHYCDIRWQNGTLAPYAVGISRDTVMSDCSGRLSLGKTLPWFVSAPSSSLNTSSHPTRIRTLASHAMFVLRGGNQNPLARAIPIIPSCSPSTKSMLNCGAISQLPTSNAYSAPMRTNNSLP